MRYWVTFEIVYPLIAAYSDRSPQVYPDKLTHQRQRSPRGLGDVILPLPVVCEAER